MLLNKISLILLGILLVLGCNNNNSVVEPDNEKEKGEVTFTVKRSTNNQSNLPEAAEKALIRVWHDGEELNRVEDIGIPDPNSTTTLEMQLPANTGYQVGVIAYAADTVEHPCAPTLNHNALAAGHTKNVEVSANSTTQVDVEVVPWKISWETENDTLTGGGTFELTLNVIQGPDSWEFFRNTEYTLALEPWEIDGKGHDSTIPCFTKTGWETATLDVPEVETDTTLYFQVAPKINFEHWDRTDMAAFQPPLVSVDSLFSIPVKPPSGSIEITFENKD